MSLLRNIIFDLGEVLLTGIRDTGIALTEQHQLENELAEHTVGWTTHRTPLLIPLIEEFFHGNVSEDEYLKEVVKTYPQIGDHSTLREKIRGNFQEIEGTREIILNLKRQNYQLALLSVHAKEWIEYCEQKFNFHELFDVRAYSYEAKISKPHPLSFTGVLGQLNAEPETCLFIDDSPINIAAAEKLGIRGIVFTSANALTADLKKLLPNFS